MAKEFVKAATFDLSVPEAKELYTYLKREFIHERYESLHKMILRLREWNTSH